MLWNKIKYQIKLHGGEGQIKTTELHGFIQQIIIAPQNFDTVWSVKIFDQDGDVIYQKLDIEGRLDDKEGFPVGQSKPEDLNVLIYDSTANENFEVILKLRESR